MSLDTRRFLGSTRPILGNQLGASFRGSLRLRFEILTIGSYEKAGVSGGWIREGDTDADG